MYRNIVFDLGGVVVNYNPKDFLMERFFHESVENKLYDAVFGSEEWLLLDKGELEWTAAEEIFRGRGDKLGLSLEMDAVLEDWPSMLTNRRATVSLLRILNKKGFNVYYLSNISKPTLALLEKRDFWPVFDGGLASFEVQQLKPDVEIYKSFLKKYDLDPQDTIFTDDVRENAAAAFQAGITGIQFKNVKNLCKMLVTYGIDM